MVLVGRRKTMALFIALGAVLILASVALYLGWVVLDWRQGLLLFLGVVMLIFIITGVVLNTIFLVREIRRNEQHDAFINAVTHELKTPVASIRLYLETLQTRAVDEAKRAEFYRIMLADSERLLETIEQVLRTSRVGQAAPRPNRTRIEMNALVEECLERVRRLHPAREPAVRYSPGPAAAILADPEDVRAAIANLIDNAVKYSGPGAQIAVETAIEEDRYVTLRVRDQGPGIEKTELKRIFKRFYRAPGQLAARVKGTGLGLFIVWAVAKRHGGRAWAESEGPGRGSTFVLQLPLAH